MRAIRALPACDESSDRTPRSGQSWTSTAGVLFGTGSVILVLGLLVGGLAGMYVLRYRARMSVRAAPELVEQYVAHIDHQNPEQLWTIWSDLEREGLNPAVRLPLEMMGQRKDIFGTVSLGGLIIAGIGLLVALSSFFFRRVES
jgi:hypothetical protein